MKNITKSSLGGIITSIIVAGCAIVVLLFVTGVAVSNSSSESPIPSVPSSPSTGNDVAAADHSGDMKAAKTPDKHGSISDINAKMELANMANDIDPSLIASVYEDAKWENMDNINPRTGESQHGWYSRDMITTLEYEHSPDFFSGSLVDHAYQISIWTIGDEIDTQIHTNHEYEVDYDQDYAVTGQPRAVINVVFDLPSGKHKYMQLAGYPGTGDAIIISPLNGPELLANIMTSTYMRMYIPVVGHDAIELMFHNESFKQLLNDEDAKTANDAMDK